MPLRDHFRPPISNSSSWEGFHGMWPCEMVRSLLPHLPDGFVAEPRVHLLTEEYEYEVLIFDEEKNRRLVAAVEIVSPGNKDRPASRRAFVAKCAALLQKRVCVSIVDLVTNRKFNLYVDLLEMIDRADPTFVKKPPVTYAVTLRGRKAKAKSFLDIWPHAMKVGQKLPTLPIWLNEDDLIPLDLEASYSEACRVLRIR